jgi:hypothetical protein
MKAPQYKAPNTRLQAPAKLQNSKSGNRIIVPGALKFGVWDLFGAWSLGFGAF